MDQRFEDMIASEIDAVKVVIMDAFYGTPHTKNLHQLVATTAFFDCALDVLVAEMAFTHGDNWKEKALMFMDSIRDKMARSTDTADCIRTWCPNITEVSAEEAK